MEVNGWHLCKASGYLHSFDWQWCVRGKAGWKENQICYCLWPPIWELQGPCEWSQMHVRRIGPVRVAVAASAMVLWGYHLPEGLGNPVVEGGGDHRCCNHTWMEHVVIVREEKRRINEPKERRRIRSYTGQEKLEGDVESDVRILGG